MLFDPGRKLIFCALAFLALPPGSSAEEAVNLVGQRYPGRLLLQKDGWIFQDEQAKSVPIKQLAYVRFETKTAFLPKVPLTKTLQLANQQRITGSLVRVDEKTLQFTASWGKTYTLLRKQVSGVEQVNDWLLLLQPRRDAPLHGWKIEGQPALDAKDTLYGNSTIRLATAGQTLVREWEPLYQDSRISLFFRCPPNPSLRWKVEALLTDHAGDKFPLLMIDKTGLHCENVDEKFGPLATTSAWRGLSIERQRGTLHFYVDDCCLGQMSVSRDICVKGIRLTALASGAKLAPVKENGALWMDGFSLAKRLTAMPAPKHDSQQDLLWLVHGEQWFGRLMSADETTVVLEAKFGKRSLAWSQLRGIGFAEPKANPARGEMDISFRPGLGLFFDCLRAKLVRWEKATLIVQHGLLGEIALDRDRLDKIRFQIE